MDWPTLLSTDRENGSSRDDPNQFGRDFDRVAYSAPFRRLQDKAQIFPLEPHDGIRTRLTHSIEVSVTAGKLADDISRLLTESRPDFDDQWCRGLIDISRTCGILHDFGNPPFGHAGEMAMREWFKDRKEVAEIQDEQLRLDLTTFEGNAQTMRILTRLQLLEGKCLNLTYGTLSAACKYKGASNGIQKTIPGRKKAGYFKSEQMIVEKIDSQTGTSGLRNPITIIVEAADDLVNRFVDIEDAVRKGVCRWSDVHSYLEENCTEDEMCSRIYQAIKDYCLASPENRPADDEDYVQLFRIFGIIECASVIAQAFSMHYDQIMEGTLEKPLVNLSEAGPLINGIEDFVHSQVHSSPVVLRLELMGQQVILKLMDFFYACTASHYDEKSGPLERFENKAFELMSKNYKQVFVADLEQGLDKRYCQLKLAADYVCGMTDAFACRVVDQICIR